MSKKNSRISNVQDIKDQLQTTKTELKDGIFVFTGKMSISDFSQLTKINANDIIKKFFLKGKMYNLNHILDEEEIAELCIENGYDFKKETNVDGSNFLDEVYFEDNEKDLVKRYPIIAVMGHVDHGKTTLIDKIRNSNIVSTESSGITQHTGAYQISHKNSKITFLDTPGHEAFTKMRARGAKVTDIIILVVAADDGVMPQTKEAIIHAKAANVPLIVFVNKMDKPNKDLDRLKGELAESEVVIEEYGGDTQIVYGSAINGQGITDLFDSITLLAELMDLKANPNRYPIGTIIESRIDKGAGAVSTVIVENGTLMKGDFIVAGSKYGRIRTLTDSQGNPIDKVIPGSPAIITGLNYAPDAGDKFVGFNDEKFAKKLANEKAVSDKMNLLHDKSLTALNADGKKVINVIVKSDVHGTSEAIKGQINGLENSDAIIKVISASAGQVNGNDILLAQASNAIIFVFNIKTPAAIKQNASSQGISLIEHDVIYKIIEDCQNFLDGEKAPIYEERKTGDAHIIKVFFYSKVGKIAGCLMDSGVAKSGAKVKVYRRGKLIHEGLIDSLRRELNDVKEVVKGKDFGTHIKDFNDIEEDDVIEFYENVRIN
ncbi:translation initiation factor IF-2 [Mycoplasmopsis canis PG 14]|uniref:Translation initiation factor IF-2 n=1 Tax=Mycoplasmopsis canis TaxID=29555 RepID=A0A449AQB3_9BACT|nr:translation initiation factor IF-2 [Mycoplasmopsis canis]AMD81335.1 translation initiation factor IF-2 [Mycoplasmopsis canis PG 14]EIE40521.1 translation initiation factor IF-2 [Mycoplasmopsis canis PG 14]VEU68691.1 Translation initiation factor IF-2 [Mycoplasmopsis canis]